MNGLKYIQKIREYCDYIEDHLLNVQKAWTIIKKCCADMDIVQNLRMHDQIESMILNHDLSKMSHEEFIPYQQKFFPVEENTLNVYPFHLAWQHHLEHNLHHW